MLPRIPSTVLIDRDRQSSWHTCVAFCLLAISLFLITLIPAPGVASAKDPAQTSVAVLTYKNDTLRTGLNSQESILTVSNVNASHFGRRMMYSVDGRVYAQPLYVPHLLMGGVQHNVVFVATEHDSVYAFDADATSRGTAPLWQTSFISPPAVVPISNNDVQCDDIGGPDAGLTGTPVIDLKTNTLYVVAATKENGKFFSRLHALDITTGQEKPHSPVTITATVSGTGLTSSKGKISFDPLQQNQRAALLLSGGVVYIAWGSHCDNDPYHGWVMGYSASTLQQVAVLSTSPNGRAVGIWQSGAGLAADKQGNIYLMTGEGTFDLDKRGSDAGDSVLKLSFQHGLHIVDYFTPFNQLCMNWFNMDLGSSGPLLVPTSNELIGVGKEGRIYVLDRAHLGSYNTVVAPCDQSSLTTVDQVVQELPPYTAPGGVWGALAYWNGPTGEYIYVSGIQAQTLTAYQLTGGQLSVYPSSQSPREFDAHKHPLRLWGNPVVSSNGSRAGTGIVWLIDKGGSLHAYDASNLAHELYSSAQNPARDKLGVAVKFSVPTVADGKVFAGTTNSLVIYGLLS